MRRRWVIIVLAGVAAAWCAPAAVAGGVHAGIAPAAAGAVTTGGWGKAIEVPGLGALNKGGNQGSGALVQSVSCASAGNCVAGGSYTDISFSSQAFVVSERKGLWRRAIEVPGSGALNSGGFAAVDSVSCPSAGNCTAGGIYSDISGEGFVVSERNGHWLKAIEVPGLGALNQAGDQDSGVLVTLVSCASAGNCAAGGSYDDANLAQQAFVASERNGHWRKAIKVAGSLNKGGIAQVNSVSCPSAGNCVAGGFYRGTGSSFFHEQAFVVSERNGVWGKAIEVAGGLNRGGPRTNGAEVTSVSCASAGNCAAGGSYTNRSGHSQAFVVSERHGTWRKAAGVAGGLNRGGNAEIGPAGCAFAGTCPGSVSCASAGNCVAGGSYTDGSHHHQAFVVSERQGVWGRAIEVAGGLNKRGNAAVSSVSCPSAGNCVAGGFYKNRFGLTAFVVSERNGRWGKAIEVPGLFALNAGRGAGLSSVSCPSAGNCAAGGFYTNRSGTSQGFVVSRT